ncbi:transposase [Sinorhizobium medicae]
MVQRRSLPGLTPRIYASGETMRSGRVSKRGDDFLRRWSNTSHLCLR